MPNVDEDPQLASWHSARLCQVLLRAGGDASRGHDGNTPSSFHNDLSLVRESSFHAADSVAKAELFVFEKALHPPGCSPPLNPLPQTSRQKSAGDTT